MLSPQALDSLLAVAAHASYTRAAQSLGLSQPAVYQHLRQLERQLGTRLVEQQGKRVVLTEHGRAVLTFARLRREAEDDLVQYLRDDASLARGSVRIAGGTTSAEFILPTIAVGFRLLHPGIDVNIIASGTTADVDTDVAHRIVDLGMHSAPREVDGVLKVPFIGDVLVGLARRDHPLARASSPVRPSRLGSESMVHFATSGQGTRPVATFQEQVDEWFAAAGLEPGAALTVGTLEGMKRAVRDGGGIAIMSQYAVDPQDADLTTFALEDPPRRDFVLVSRASGWESTVVRAFREYALSFAWAAGDPRGFRPPVAAASAGGELSPRRPGRRTA